MSISALLKDPEALVKDLGDFFFSKEAFEGGMSGLSYGNGLMTAVIAGPEFGFGNRVASAAHECLGHDPG